MLLPDDGRASPRDIALVEGETGQAWSRAALRNAVAALGELLPGPKALVFIFCRNDAFSVVSYLACLQRGHAAALLDADASPALQQRLVDLYEPDWILASEGGAWGGPYLRRELSGGHLLRRGVPGPVRPFPGLSLLLSTSGTTGSPKFVRLSDLNLASNAESIASYLELGPGERALAHLPLHYSYGLSVLNSHLRAGATVVLSRAGLLQPAFWRTMAQERCTSLAGVPYTFSMLTRLRFERMDLPCLRTLTSAGGALDMASVLRYDSLMKSRAGRLFVMYGQTEATARMSYLPPESLPEKAGSVGIAIPGGALRLREDGEVVYSGPNVSLGYANGPADLSLGDERRGVLETGDIGTLDAHGFLTLTGRKSRFSKVFGLRISLDEVEQRVRSRGPAAAAAGPDRIVVFCESADPAGLEALRLELAREYRVNHSAFELRRVERLPLKPSGKVDYDRLVI
jgi:long-chain acyl-CoA synthetase